MDKIVITITGVKLAPSWETLQTLLRQALNNDDATINKIERRDKGVDYRALGVYDLGLIRCEHTSAELHVS